MNTARHQAGDTRSFDPRWRVVVLGLAVAIGLTGLASTALGGWLVALGGTPYYLLAGLLLIATSALLWTGRYRAGQWTFALTLAATFAWALWEIAGKGWMPGWGLDLAGRTGVLTVLFLLTVLACAYGRRDRSAATGRRWATALAAGAAAALVLTIAVLWERPVAPSTQAAQVRDFEASAPPSGEGKRGRAALANTASEWTAFGGSNFGQRYSPADQITPSNVARLREVWRFSTEDMPPNERVFYSAQNTPLKIGDTLYVCSSANKVFALDPASGTVKWRFDPEVKPRAMESLFSVACRSVGYHERAGELSTQACARRIFVATADGRLFALDAETGQRCTSFGQNGIVDLTAGMGLRETGFASNTSGPTVTGDLVLVGQQVSDNQRRDAPSGVVRAYDATTGALRWAWDAERIDRPQQPLAEGEIWPRGTPNVWNVISADETLGLAYLGTGNAANDHYGGNRSAADDEYTSAVVAVDLGTGATRWHYRTVLNDRWDYDIGAQPVIADLRIGGDLRRVLIQVTKTGSIFVLDAATGEPLRPVEMKPAPQGAVPGERLSPVQPQAVYYPNLSGAPGPDPERIDASYAFGIAVLDAAWCRIQFHRMRYEGIYTPPTTEGIGMLLLPGTIGGPNWGGIAIDRQRGILITNHSRLANQVRLIPRDQVQDPPIGDGGARPDQEVAPQQGAPWGVDRPIWFSPLRVPCISPPWGYLAATDLESGRLIWSQPLGTGFDMGPLGIPSRLGIAIGTPNIGGPVATASGLTFIAAAQDNFLRAFETATGRLLWSARLPAGGQSGPMTYMHAGRQYVAISATGHERLQTRVGDTIVVYALQ